MMDRAEKIAEALKEKAERYTYLDDLLDKANDVEAFWDELRSEFGDKCGWVSEQVSKMTQEIESEMAEIEEALE